MWFTWWPERCNAASRLRTKMPSSSGVGGDQERQRSIHCGPRFTVTHALLLVTPSKSNKTGLWGISHAFSMWSIPEDCVGQDNTRNLHWHVLSSTQSCMHLNIIMCYREIEAKSLCKRKNISQSTSSTWFYVNVSIYKRSLVCPFFLIRRVLWTTDKQKYTITVDPLYL